jgi:pseudouridine synthase
MNLQKYFSGQKIMSRRETERAILKGKIKVNGEVVKNLATQINHEKDQIEVIGLEEKTTILFNKPRGISSSKVEAESKNIFDLLPQFKYLNAIGRLDKESNGLILLSNDGILTNIITGQDHVIEKEYLIEVREQLNQSKMNALSQGMILSDGPTLPAKAEMLDDHTFSIVLKEGRNHQIRRMADRVKLTVLNLKRVRIGSLELGNIPVGGFRQATKEEIQGFKI